MVITGNDGKLKTPWADASNCDIIESSSAQIGLGHTSLSIIDLSEHGSQPMFFSNHWICFNGEVYNFNEIKKRLENLGHEFIGTSDTEVVLHSYIEWGEKCLEEFVGMFAFVIYNVKNESVFAERSRWSKTPFLLLP